MRVANLVRDADRKGVAMSVGAGTTRIPRFYSGKLRDLGIDGVHDAKVNSVNIGAAQSGSVLKVEMTAESGAQIELQCEGVVVASVWEFEPGNVIFDVAITSGGTRVQCGRALLDSGLKLEKIRTDEISAAMESGDLFLLELQPTMGCAIALVASSIAFKVSENG